MRDQLRLLQVPPAARPCRQTTPPSGAKISRGPSVTDPDNCSLWAPAGSTLGLLETRTVARTGHEPLTDPRLDALAKQQRVSDGCSPLRTLDGIAPLHPLAHRFDRDPAERRLLRAHARDVIHHRDETRHASTCAWSSVVHGADTQWFGRSKGADLRPISRTERDRAARPSCSRRPADARRVGSGR